MKTEQQLAKQQAAATLPAAAAATPPATTAATPAVDADPETSNPEEPDACLVFAAPESSDSEPNPFLVFFRMEEEQQLAKQQTTATLAAAGA